MTAEQYIKAQKLGLKEQEARAQAGESPYLPALDEKVGHINALKRIPMGIVNIPIARIQGTLTRVRANAFASNFMPLLGPYSEFGIKWRKLYDNILSEGVRHPVTAIEYLNRFYIIEGNKRVSISKYLGAFSIEGDVVRIMPPDDQDDPETRLYREYLPFNADSGVNYIWFSKEGSVEKLYRLIGMTPGVKWTDDDRTAFSSCYFYFRSVFRQVFGDKISVTSGDAFLVYLAVYGYDGDKILADEEIHDRVKKLSREFQQLDEEKNVEIIMHPNEQAENSSFLSTLFGRSTINVGFIHTTSPEDSGWNYWHDLGRINMEQAMNGHAKTEVAICRESAACEEEIERMIKNGADLIFTTSPALLDACIRPSVEHPEVKILNCSLLASYHNVRSYYIRLYEVKYLLGMIAGALAENDRIGYVADYPIYGSASCINAFALGARAMNPRAKVHLKWSASKDYNPLQPFKDPGIRIISTRDMSAPARVSKRQGLYRIADSEIENIALPVFDWSRFYTMLARTILNGRWGTDQNGARALDYWWGVSSDAVDIAISERLDARVRRLVDLVHEELRSMAFTPFEGLILDQDGNEKCLDQERMSPAKVLTMNWLCDNVDGEIPHIDTLREEAKTLVRLQGLNVIRHPDEARFSWADNYPKEVY